MSPPPQMQMHLSGIASIDEQHAKLLETLRELRTWVQKGKGDIAVFGTVSFLERYASEHFAHEEHLMREARYPGLPGQIESHNDLRERVSQFAEDLIAGKSVTLDILVAMEEWFTTHINDEAVAFRRWPDMREL